MKIANRLFAAFALLTLASLACLLAVPGVALAEDGAAPALTRVEAKKVCMVNDALFQKDQIPVEVEGRTYYGCCNMCKERLAQDAAARTATDPVTGRPVDKAEAVLGAKPDGSVLYFESEETFERYLEGGTEEPSSSR